MYITIDIGGTNTRIVTIKKNAIINKRLKFKTDKLNPINTLKKVLNFISLYNDIEGIGISVPGPADYRKGILLELPNLPGWRGFDLLKYMKENTSIMNIKMANDANLMALANHFYFSRTKKDVTQFFTISTGLGAGLIINDKIYEGPGGYAQEVAKMPLSWIKDESNGLGPGALEYFASGSGLMARGKKYGSTTKEIINNKKASKIIKDGIESLANVIAASVGFLNPSLIVFDGSVARNNKWYVEKAIKLSKGRMYHSQFKSTKFEYAELGDDSALIGAYYLVKK